MKINFIKTSSDHVLSCERKDGSITWRHITPFFISHDLCHIAVETTIPLRNAFFGMIANGIDISEFDRPKDQRTIQLNDEALLAEHLVNLLTIEYSQGKIENFVEILSSIYKENGGASLNNIITEKKLEQIRNKFNELMVQWQSVPANGSMTLEL